MPTADRRERERSNRRDLIVSAARELAETEGWDAVTTRRLADQVQYSQPVLYSHFANKDAIVAAVALDGFAELTEILARARRQAGTPLRAVLQAYLDFGATRPALYQAMFALPIDVRFGGGDQTPTQLRAAFDEIVTVLEPVAHGRDVPALAELTWSTLHGIVDLTRTGRLPPQSGTARLDLLEQLVTTS
jgi:AcrR family transcriptional regulator